MRAEFDKIAEAQCYVYAQFDRVDIAVVKNDIDVERGMLGQENGKTGDNVQAGKGHRRGNAQSSCNVAASTRAAASACSASSMVRLARS